MIVECDLNAAELRVCAHLAGDEAFLTALPSGKVHQATWRQLFQQPPDAVVDKKSDEYTFSKSFTFKWIYTHPDKAPSLNPGQLRLSKVQLTGQDLARMQAHMNKVHPWIVAWKRQQLASLYKRSRVYNAWGRYRNLGWALNAPLDFDGRLRAHAENAALNFPIQSAIGEVVREAFITAFDNIQARELKGWLIANVHDSLVAYTPDPKEAGTLSLILQEALEAPIPQLGGLIIPSEVKVGTNWGNVR